MDPDLQDDPNQTTIELIAGMRLIGQALARLIEQVNETLFTAQAILSAYERKVEHLRAKEREH